MSVLKYWDAVSNTYKILSGPPGPANPYIVVTDLTTNPPNVNAPPVNPPMGLLVADTSVPDPTTAYLQLTGGTMTGPLVMANGSTAVTQPPGDADQSVATTAFVAPAFNAIGRNKFHNGLFRVQQRGTGSWAVTGSYGPDRWRLDFSLDTTSFYLTAFGVIGVPGDEEAATALAVAVTGNAGAASYSFFSQSIEGVKRLSNKTITVSFTAYTTSGTAKIGVGLRQFFGTGGSPSTIVDLNAIPVSISTTAQRYSVTINVPSIAGKTLGSNGDDCTRISFWLSCGATNNNVLAGGIGVQSNTFVFWGMQCEIGGTATQLEKLDIALDRLQCMRFFYAPAGYAYASGYHPTAASLSIFAMRFFPVPMRAPPTVSGQTYGGVNNNAGSLNSVTAMHAIYTCTNTAAGAFQLGVSGEQYSADF